MKEYQTLKDNGTWEYVRRDSLPKDTKIHHVMWVWVDKYDKDLNHVELRGRWVFLGNHQLRGTDYIIKRFRQLDDPAHNEYATPSHLVKN